ncbi:MAG: hypothetical protein KKF85_16435 [Gammaproteobacteria bacterium]|nr:hypothetical protein [Rhodocyclaceae bacterium]MBU3910780.1 hypothetical protein [Gammaproteobacteria bacterium]MBU3989401.1 hypothetical protein [Gammaproteobacteria bacterium]MBU4006234.1 hypothetical protein [Gammaproteobacteria bacterium]MBU4097841.1 hypothetical protein [Gammaproteobacteria bacterium]
MSDNKLAIGIFTRYAPAFHPAIRRGCREKAIPFDIQPQRIAAANSASGLSAEGNSSLDPLTAPAAGYLKRGAL